MSKPSIEKWSAKFLAGELKVESKKKAKKEVENVEQA